MEFLESTVAVFQSQKKLAEAAFAQLSDDQLREPLDRNTNSVAIIIKHMAGNMLSRWTDFLESDGEKEWRDRDREFIDDFTARDEIEALWEKGWTCLFTTLDSLSEADLTKKITIRGEALSVYRAIQRQIDHYGYHVGQIVLTSKLLVKENWGTLSIPRGGSQEYNEKVWKS